MLVVRVLVHATINVGMDVHVTIYHFIVLKSPILMCLLWISSIQGIISENILFLTTFCMNAYLYSQNYTAKTTCISQRYWDKLDWVRPQVCLSESIAELKLEPLYLLSDKLSNPPVITSFNGEIVEGHGVTIASDTEIDNSCSLMLNGQYYIFGGYQKNKQVSLRSSASILQIPFDSTVNAQ